MGQANKRGLCQKYLQVEKRPRRPWITTGVATGDSPCATNTSVSDRSLGRAGPCGQVHLIPLLSWSTVVLRPTHLQPVWLGGSLRVQERSPLAGGSVRMYWAHAQGGPQRVTRLGPDSGKSSSICPFRFTVSYPWNIVGNGLCFPALLMLRAKSGHLVETANCSLIFLLSFSQSNRSPLWTLQLNMQLPRTKTTFLSHPCSSALPWN